MHYPDFMKSSEYPAYCYSNQMITVWGTKFGNCESLYDFNSNLQLCLNYSLQTFAGSLVQY